MKFVVDANVIFSAAIRDSKTAELLLRDDFALYAPESLFEEFEKYREILTEKTHRTDEEFERFVEVLRSRIETVPREAFADEMTEARKVSPDEKDAPYIALALSLDADLWTDDAELGEQDSVDVYTTTEVVEKFTR
ncbi:MAG: PIN domain-containing protein [Halobacteriales archaeon]|nr:PIN domain-containing protein [Halobacteriales archaeon]